jgi:hypothetical protein
LRETDNAFAGFGRAVMEWILDYPDWWDDEFSEDIMPLAEKFGLAERVPYNPEIHGEGVDAGTDDEIWWIDREKWPATDDTIARLHADIERITAERDALQARLSKLEDDGK